MAFLEEYTLLSELGQGGYATVYKVRHNNLGYIRAIRVLNATIARGESDKIYQKFLEECRLLLRLGNGNHPNIVHIYQPLLRAQKAIVEMDFVDGNDLLQYLEKRSYFVEIEDVMKLLTDISSALAYCHEDIYKFCMDKEEDYLEDDPDDPNEVSKKQLEDPEIRRRLIEHYRVIHNDIHSRNIIRRGNGNYVLLDFGLAAEEDDVFRSSKKRNGAPEFKAPEKWDGDTPLTTRSDIYSFGVVLYEFLSGRVPFLFDKKNSNRTEAEHLLYKAHIEKKPEPIYAFRKKAFEESHPGETYNKDYPDWLEDLIMKCLEKDPEDRFSDGKELDIYVRQMLSEHSGSADISALRRENRELREEMESLKNISDISTKQVDDLVLDLQEQLKESMTIRKDLNERINTLHNQNHSLKEQLETLSESGELNRTQSQQIRKLEEQLTSSKRKLETVSSELESQKQRSRGNKVWKIIAVASVLVSISLFSIFGVDIYNKCNEAPKEVTALHDSKDRKLIDSLSSQIKDRESKINDLNSKIKALAAEISTLKSANKDMVNRNLLTERDATISQLRIQVRDLKDSIMNNNKEIEVLRRHLLN